MDKMFVVRDWRIYLLTPLSVLGIDLFSKYLAERTLSFGQPLRLIGDVFRFTLVYNEGTTFGLFAASSPVLAISLVKLALTGAVFFCCLHIPRFIHGGRQQLISRISLMAVVGGSLGNLIDRLVDGKVTDFIDLGFLTFRWFVFNLADGFQAIGGLTVLSFIVWHYFGGKQTDAEPEVK